MKKLKSKLTIKKDTTIYDYFDDEVVVVNLDKGSYFSLRDEACFLWKIIDKCKDIEELLTVSGKHENQDFKSKIEGFIDKAKEEGLVFETQDIETSALSEEEKENILKFESYPKIERYTDMQELLLLDPIHETTEDGWPKK